MKLNLYENDPDNKYLVKLVNTDATAGIKGVAYNVSGGKQVAGGFDGLGEDQLGVAGCQVQADRLALMLVNRC